jgi:DNA-directed RNA polymerase subunit RPC12/RpoP
LTHTQCLSCGGINCQEVEDDDNGKEYDTDNRDCIVCPHCGHEHTDTTDYDSGEYDCQECGKAFVLTAEISVSYTTIKAEGAEG